MIKLLNWLTKEPFYRLLIGAVAILFVIVLTEAYWIGGISVVLYLFLLGYAKLIKKQ